MLLFFARSKLSLVFFFSQMIFYFSRPSLVFVYLFHLMRIDRLRLLRLIRDSLVNHLLVRLRFPMICSYRRRIGFENYYRLLLLLLLLLFVFYWCVLFDFCC